MPGLGRHRSHPHPGEDAQGEARRRRGQPRLRRQRAQRRLPHGPAGRGVAGPPVTGAPEVASGTCGGKSRSAAAARRPSLTCADSLLRTTAPLRSPSRRTRTGSSGWPRGTVLSPGASSPSRLPAGLGLTPLAALRRIARLEQDIRSPADTSSGPWEDPVPVPPECHRGPFPGVQSPRPSAYLLSPRASSGSPSTRRPGSASPAARATP